ncbi:DnaJ domain-containing protein [Roseibium polysiphoniae]|uniref:DnaJ domain-containing protein n=1 Tax=Roseibium polysiphoniae TaxID=2571221 RepID=A0ABR9C6G9_9HYPH|nr:DnaJ domain-containing protein [Roseibium polysiphoniae]MBD8875487.1 DnaJ domain-containing protein [Roseibium polysiphoniae]
MIYLILGLAVLAFFLLAGNGFVRANPADLARQLKTAGGIGLLLLAALLAVTGRFGFAIGAAGFGLTLLGMRNSPGGRGGGRPSGGQISKVRAAMVEMELDHDSGAMRGIILAGQFDGHSLDDLSDEDLKTFWEETAADGQSRSLVEAYLDRRLSSWREDFQADGTERQGRATSSGAMTDQEAYEVLGLSPDAGDAEIRAAHRRLMKRLHPDHGGTAFLAAKLNEAKDRLLRRH